MDVDQPVVVGRRLPVVSDVRALEPFRVAVTWEGTASEQLVDLEPMLERFALYAPLRENAALFAGVAVGPYGSSIEWSDGAIDVSVTALEYLIAGCEGPSTAAGIET
ncbi:DUF2442 domain-containing protein [Salinarimonas ramus]|uniref:DUF2442 domain-containing protein n=1 Tax=Salinarimonas ramus TaxID=690164 RepID=A0A917V579_9HYPH|nr:DUF2442 domain-containing protein [Salinarimonas ramus]GGK39452.1 hypothetical protein GCM10011322_28220 [Salinarimonas ramus]